MSTRTLAALAVGAVAILALQSCEVRQASKLPLLLVTLDTTRADRLQPYGAEDAETPNLLALARDGVLFERAYAATPVTLPSHATLFTGLDPPAHGVRNNGGHYLAADLPTLAEILARRGWRTAAFVSAAVLDRRYGLDRGFEVYDDDLSAGKVRQLRLNVERPAAATVTAARRWLDSLDPAEEFFLWVHLFDPHAGYSPPAPWDERFRHRPYDGEIASMDAEIGRLLAHPRLRREAALVMVIADHGESLGEHGEDTHAMLAYDATLRVPWLVRLPGGSPGRRLAHPVGQVDLLPTVLDLLEVDEDLRVSGVSQAGPIRGEEAVAGASQRVLYAETMVPLYTYGWAGLRTVRAGRWKLIDGPAPELYDLEADPGELVDLARQRPRQLAQLRRTLQALAPEEPRAEVTLAVDRSTREQLESLGYVAPRVAPDRRRERPDPKRMMEVHLAVERAQHLFYRLELDRATALLRGVLARDGDNLAAIATLARTLAAQRRFDEALRFARRAVELDPQSPDHRVTLAVIEASRGQLEPALAALDAALGLDPRSPDAKIEKVRCLARLDRVEEAVAMLGPMLEEDPDNARAQVAYAELVELPARQLAAAADRLRTALAREPHLGEGWRVLGQVLEAAGRPGEAIEVYRQGLEHRPRDGTLHARLGLQLASRRDDGRAEEHLRRAAELMARDSPAVHNGLAAILLRRREWAAAEAEARRALELDPSLGGAWNHLAIALEEKGEIDGALATFDLAREKDPDNWQAEFNKGLLLRKLERYREAAAAFRRVLVLEPGHAKSHLELGVLLAAALGDPALARRHLIAAIEADPEHPRTAQVRELLRQLGPP